MAHDLSDIAELIRSAPWDSLQPQLLHHADFTMRKGLGWGAAAISDGRPCIEGRDAAWFLDEAIKKTLDGTRKWNPEAVDLRRHLSEVIRSLIDSHLKSVVVRNRINLIADKAGTVASIEGRPDPGPTSADSIARGELLREQNKLIRAFRAHIADDAELIALFDAYDAEYYDPREIAAVTSLKVDRIYELSRKLKTKYVKFTMTYSGPLEQSDLVIARRRK